MSILMMCFSVFSRFNLAFIFLILVKIAKAVSKSMHSSILKICNEIEFTLIYGEVCHSSQNTRQRNFNPQLNCTQPQALNSADFLICDLSVGEKITIRHLKKHEIIRNFSESTYYKSSLEGVAVQETSSLKWPEPQTIFDGEIPIPDSFVQLNDVYVSHGRRDKNLAKSDQEFPKSIRKFPNAEPQKTKIFAKVSDESSYLQIFKQNFKSSLNEMNRAKKEISEHDSLNVSSQPFENRHELQSFPLKAATLCQRTCDEIILIDKKDTLEGNIQSEETQYFKDKRNNSDTYIIENNALDSNSPDFNCSFSDHESEIGCQNDKGYIKREDHGVKTKELCLSFSKDNCKFPSSFQIDNKDESQSSHFCENLEFQNKDPLNFSKANSIEGSEGNLNPFKATSVDQCDIACSDGPIIEMLNDKVCNGWKTKTLQGSEKALENTMPGEAGTSNVLPLSINDKTKEVQDTEKALDNTKCEGNFLTEASFSIDAEINTSKSTPSILEAPNSVRQYDKECPSSFLELNAIITELEVNLIFFCKQKIEANEFSRELNERHAIFYYLKALWDIPHLKVNTAYQTSIVAYINGIKKVFKQLREDFEEPSLESNASRSKSFLKDLNSKLMKLRETLLLDIKKLTNFAEDMPSPSRKNKSKRKRK